MTGSHISLFSGVGMTDLAAEALGFKTIATAEIDPWNRSILSKRFPDALHYDDVRAVEARNPYFADGFALGHHKHPLLVSGGFPCQDVSGAGHGKGLDGERSGLWSEMLRVIREFQPDYVLAENVAMLRSRGLDRVLNDLHHAGYDVQWDCIPAAAVGAPHLRDRIYIGAVRSGSKPGREGGDKIVGVVRKGGVWRRDKQITKLPRAGAMKAGIVMERKPAHTIRDAKASLAAHQHACAVTGTGAWPTPDASVAQDGEQPATWLARRETLKAKGINGNGAGMPLAMAVKLYPTPRAAPNEWRTTRNAPSHGKSHGATLAGTINDEEREAGRPVGKSSESAGNLNPDWVEWLMGLPEGWTNPSVPNGALVGHNGWTVEPQPRTVTGAPNRRPRLVALGNGLVPQCAKIALTDLLAW